MKAVVLLGIVIGALIMAWAVLRVTDGQQEDYLYVASFRGAPMPNVTLDPVRSVLWRPRILLNLSLWWQINHGITPQAMRRWNLALALIVAIFAGWLGHRIGLEGVIVGGVMLLHPLTIETVSTMSGRAELIAAVGVLVACLGATIRSGWVIVPIVMGLAIGLAGKETAGIGIVLVLLVWRLAHPARIWSWVTAAVFAALLWVAWQQSIRCSASRMPFSGFRLSRRRSAFRLGLLKIQQ